MKRILLLFVVCAYACLGATTTISDTVHFASGAKASGYVIISPTASFTAQDGTFVGGQQQKFTITNGVITVSLEPTDTAFPPGVSYVIQYFLNDGSQHTEYWYVPTTTSTLTISQIRSTQRTVPTTVIPLAQIAPMNGTVGQVPCLNSLKVWTPCSVSGANLISGKGYLLTSDNFTQQGIAPGSDGSTLVADSSQSVGLNWALREFPLTFSAPLSRSGNIISAPTAVVTTGTYADPSWLTALSASKLTGAIPSGSLPAATSSTAGAVVCGTGLTCSTGTISANFGNSPGTVMQGSDSRITNSVQTSNAYADPSWITALGAGKLTGTVNAVNLPAATTSSKGAVIISTGLAVDASGNASVAYGTSASTAAQGNDSRITGAVQTGGSYASPAWLTSIAAGIITGNLPYSQVSGLASSATVDATNAGNITAGTLAAARLPLPTTNAVGAVKSLTCSSGYHVSAIDTTGTPICTVDTGVSGALLVTNNLSDVASASTARANLGLGTSATHAATDFTLAANNLSDLTSASSARANLALGTAATQPASAFLQPGNNLSDLGSVVTARNNLQLVASATTDTTNANNIGSGILNSARLPGTVVQTSGGSIFGAFTYDFSAVAHSLPAKVGVTSAKPATCTIGEQYFATDAAAGSNLYFCTSSNTWTQGSGASGGLLAANNLSDLTNAGSARGNLALGSAATQNTSAFLQPGNNLSEVSNPATARSNLGLPASSVTDTTNAANISSGILAAGRLPDPTSSTLGGVESYAAVSHQFLTSIGTNGVPVSAQPVAADIGGLANSATVDATNATNIGSGTLPAGRLPLPTSSALGGVQAFTASSHQYLNGISTSGVPQAAQPSAADITGLANSATVDATNAGNIGTGTLSTSRLPATVLLSGTDISLSGNLFDVTGDAHTRPVKVGALSSRPTTCAIGEFYFASDATAGQNVYLCTASNTWTQQNGSGSVAGLQAANNLSDVSSVSAARSNLGLTSLATTSSAAVLLGANNLSDIGSASAARGNLGLGSAAVLNTSGVLLPGNNLADVGSVATARANLQLVASAITDTTNASNIASGTLNSARLPGTVIQSGTNIAITGNSFDVSGETHTLPAVKGTIAAKPATCTVSEFYFATDATAGANLYLCTATNTWTQQANLANALVAANNLSDVANAATTRTNLGLTSTATTALASLLQGANNLSDLASVATARANLQLVASAITDTTNASNIASGTLNSARLPAIASTSLSDTSIIQRTNQVNTLTNQSAPATPSSGLTSLWVSSSDKNLKVLNDAGTTSITVIPSDQYPSSHYYATGVNANGSLNQRQIAATDITGLANSATVDATNANNITQGLISSSLLPTATVYKNASVQWTSAVTVDASLAAHSLPYKVGTMSQKPGTCTLGEGYFATDAAVPGQNVYLCTSANTWTLASGTSSGTTGALIATNNLSDLSNITTARANLQLSASATTDATNASNIVSGILGAARLPAPTASTLGAVKALSCPSGHISSLDTTGTFTCTADSGGGTSTAINGTSVPTNGASDQVLLTTAASTGSWASIPTCPDTAGQHLNYNTTTHAWTCGSTGGTGSPSLTGIPYNNGLTGAGTRTTLAKVADFTNVLDFGAVCDGITDDSAHIQAALNAANVVYLPDNKTCVAQNLVLNSGNTLRGGLNSVLKKVASTPTTFLIFPQSVSNISIENIQIDDNGNAQTSVSGHALIFCNNCTRFNVLNNQFYSSGGSEFVTPIYYYQTSGQIAGNTVKNSLTSYQIFIDEGGSGKHVQILNNSLDGTIANGIEISNQSGEASAPVEAAGNQITNVTDGENGTGQTGNAIAVYHADGALVHDNLMNNVRFSAVRITSSNAVMNYNNWSTGTQEWAMWAELGASGCHIYHNHIFNYVSGISDTNVSQRTIDMPNYIESNWLTNGTDVGIHVEHGVVQENVIDSVPLPIKVGAGSTTHNNVVKNNRILHSSTSYTPVDIGILLDPGVTTGVDTISGNTIEGTPTIAPIQGGYEQSFGITSISQASSAVIGVSGTLPANGNYVCFHGVQNMTQINGLCGTVSSASGTSFTVSINTSGFSAFSISTPDPYPNAGWIVYSSGTTPNWNIGSTYLLQDQSMTYSVQSGANAQNSSRVWDTDGTVGSTCAGSGTGAWAYRTGGTWSCVAPGSGAGATATPGGSSGQVQYNNSGALGADSGLTYNNSTHVVTATGGFQSGGTGTGQIGFTDSSSSNVVTLTATSGTTANYTLSLPPTGMSSTATISQFSAGTPTVGWGTGAGTSPTSTSISGSNSKFSLQFTAGSSPGSGTIATVTFSTAFTNTPTCGVDPNGVAPTNLGWTPSTSSIVITDTAAVTASTTYKLVVDCK